MSKATIKVTNHKEIPSGMPIRGTRYGTLLNNGTVILGFHTDDHTVEITCTREWAKDLAQSLAKGMGPDGPDGDDLCAIIEKRVKEHPETEVVRLTPTMKYLLRERGRLDYAIRQGVEVSCTVCGLNVVEDYDIDAISFDPKGLTAGAIESLIRERAYEDRNIKTVKLSWKMIFLMEEESKLNTVGSVRSCYGIRIVEDDTVTEPVFE